MSAWLLASYAAIAVSALMIIWMIVDVVNVEKNYTNEMLTSSREGELEATVEAQHKKGGG